MSRKSVLNVRGSSFRTEICTFYYLWKDENSGVSLLFVGASEEAFENFCNDCLGGSRNITRESLPQFEDEIKSYLEGRIDKLSFGIKFLKGTEFEVKVWQKTRLVPYGKTITYEELSRLVGHPESYRAVGNALGKNPVMLLVPCHRVIRKNGHTGGFSAGTDIKRALLEIERRNIVNSK